MDAALERFGKSRAAFYDAGSQRFEKGTRKCSACCAYKKAKDFSKDEAARPAARRLCKSCAQSAPPKPAPKRKSAAPAAKKQSFADPFGAPAAKKASFSDPFAAAAPKAAAERRGHSDGSARQ